MRPLALVALLAGCGGWQGIATPAQDLLAESHRAADASVAAGYDRAAPKALETAQSREEYEGIMAPWDAAVGSVEALGGALGCAIAALDVLVSDMEAVGLDTSGMDAAMESLADYRGLCAER